ncbi:hypothetical protein [Saccharopolyspora karakumensis]|uniref:hypothetical protein n=1 Tax=Saccharopolyspora karakumensis TaxID=2530386 RepID=UPI0014055373|nr:hypothetical protein [Saccharopolyspora karakumensis]
MVNIGCPLDCTGIRAVDLNAVCEEDVGIAIRGIGVGDVVEVVGFWPGGRING